MITPKQQTASLYIPAMIQRVSKVLMMVNAEVCGCRHEGTTMFGRIGTTSAGALF
jgi:Glu-tRNA(Gln) amidotransferase subunit E-like FAD-binding protein